MQKYIFTLFLIIATPLSAAQKLVQTEWLQANLGKPGIALIDMSDEIQYQRFHIPGAINLPYDYLNQSQHGLSQSIGQPRVIQLLGQLGIAQDTNVIVCDDMGGLNAARLLWELEQLGHPDMAMLDGGLVKWIREGRKVSFQPPEIHPVVYQAKTTGTPATASLKDVDPNSRAKDTFLLDVRSPEEYTGDPRIPRTGHIPGAKLWSWDKALDLDAGFTLHDSSTLKSELEKAGLHDAKQPVVVYCQSGHRASHAYFTLRQLGFENVRVYDGSMQEYGSQKTLPLTMGTQP